MVSDTRFQRLVEKDNRECIAGIGNIGWEKSKFWKNIFNIVQIISLFRKFKVSSLKHENQRISRKSDIISKVG